MPISSNSSPRRLALWVFDAILVLIAVVVVVQAARVVRVRKSGMNGPVVGENIALNANWSRTPRTLVLVLQKGCHFCTDSAPFYRRLQSVRQSSRRFSLVAAVPQGGTEAVSYLRELGLSVDELFSGANLKTLRISGTPTVMLTDQKGKVLAMWRGQLKPMDEEEVLRRLLEP